MKAHHTLAAIALLFVTALTPMSAMAEDGRDLDIRGDIYGEDPFLDPDVPPLGDVELGSSPRSHGLGASEKLMSDYFHELSQAIEEWADFLEI